MSHLSLMEQQSVDGGGTCTLVETHKGFRVRAASRFGATLLAQRFPTYATTHSDSGITRQQKLRMGIDSH